MRQLVKITFINAADYDYFELKVDGDTAEIEIKIPENCRGRLYLPDGWVTDASEYPHDGVDYFNLKSLNKINIIKNRVYNKNQISSNSVDFYDR